MKVEAWKAMFIIFVIIMCVQEFSLSLSLNIRDQLLLAIHTAVTLVDCVSSVDVEMKTALAARCATTDEVFVLHDKMLHWALDLTQSRNIAQSVVNCLHEDFFVESFRAEEQALLAGRA